jgi:hypothetical protein
MHDASSVFRAAGMIILAISVGSVVLGGLIAGVVLIASSIRQKMEEKEDDLAPFVRAEEDARVGE